MSLFGFLPPGLFEPQGQPIHPSLQGLGELGGLLRPDGGMSTELQITVEDKRLNNGRPTNIPSLVEGQQNIRALLIGAFPDDEQQEIAIQRAVERTKGKFGIEFPNYDTIEEAVEASIRNSQRKQR